VVALLADISTCRPTDPPRPAGRCTRYRRRASARRTVAVSSPASRSLPAAFVLTDSRRSDGAPVGVRRPVDHRLVDLRLVDLRPVDLRPVDLRPVDLRPVDLRSVDHRPVDGQPVWWFRRAIAIGLLVAVILCSWIAVRAALGRIGGGPLAITGAPGGLQRAAARIWIVRPGDTLWSIAEAVDPRGDVRPLVDRLAAETGRTVLYPGEAISVPNA
jgi:hypothetical protein